mmetsp:Transcript_63346/g.87115  ORF Transcript_63346/g.87115 Transcript_63346/m.87115 type:complete len:82 (-) Transcript_63346:297-542(-)
MVHTSEMSYSATMMSSSRTCQCTELSFGERHGRNLEWLGRFISPSLMTGIPLDLAKKNQRAVWIVFALHIKEKSTQPNISG